MKKSNEFLPLPTHKLTIFLADDDKADCLIFKEALKELPVSAKLTTFEKTKQTSRYSFPRPQYATKKRLRIFRRNKT
jgi:hypothetical protein